MAKSTSITILISLICLVATGMAVLQEFTLYAEKDQQGDSVTLTGKYHTFPQFWKDFIALHGPYQNLSFCVKGWFGFYVLENFDISGAQWGMSWTEEEYCSNMHTNITDKTSGRVFGPRNTESLAIGLYETVSQGGEEFLVEGRAAANNFPFEVKGYALFGFSNWTLFEGNDFDGNSTCVRSEKLVERGSYLPFPVRSVVRGC